MSPLFAALSVFLLAGSPSPEENQQRRLEELQGLYQLLRERGVSEGRISIFWGDGEAPEPDRALPRRDDDPLFWLLAGSPQDALTLGAASLVNTSWPQRALLPARRSALQQRLTDEGARLRSGDTLLIVVTGRGQSLLNAQRDAQTPERRESAISLWDEPWRTEAFLADLDPIPSGVQVIFWMSQCYSGGFAQLAGRRAGLCGVTSIAVEGLSYACLQGEALPLSQGHFFQLQETLLSAGSLGAASDQLLLSDGGPDTPLRSSDAFLTTTLREYAEAQGIPESHLIDDRLPRAGASVSATERVLLQRAAQLSVRYGLGQVSSFSEAELLLKRLQDARHELDAWTLRWERLYSSTQRRLLREVSRGLTLSPEQSAAQRQRQRRRLYQRLRRRGRRRQLSPRLRPLYERVRAAHALAAELALREAVAFRVATLYRRLSAPYLLPPGESALWTRLQRCEERPLFEFAGEESALSPTPLAPLVPLEPLSKLFAQIAELRPGYLAVHYRDLPRFRGVELRELFHGSPAWAAALERGDQIVSIDGAPLREEGDFPEQIALAPPGSLLRLRLRRGGRALATSVAVVGAPLAPAAPRVGELIPPLPLESLSLENDTPLVGDGRGTILFFWATWCRRCAQLAPRLARWAFEHDLQVIAIAHEDRSLVQANLRARPLPFTTALDRRRETARLFRLSLDEDPQLPQLIYIDGERRFLLRTTWPGEQLPEPLQLLFEAPP